MYNDYQDSQEQRKTKPFKAIIALGLIAVFLIGAVILYMATHTNIKAGYVGYMYDRNLKQNDPKAIPGTSVIDQPLTGRVTINPITQELYLYPTTIVSRSWTLNGEGKKDTDEAFVLGTKEGQNFKVDVYLSVSPADTGLVIKNWGGLDFDVIVDREVYGLAKGRASAISQAYSIYDVQSQKSEMQEKIFTSLEKELFDKYGIKLNRFEFGNTELPIEIQAKIDEKASAINAVELAKLDRAKQDELNKKIVDQQRAESERDLVQKQQAADASAYQLERDAEARKAAAQNNLEAARLEKQAALEIQQSYTAAYLRNRELDVAETAVKSINEKLQIVVTDGKDNPLSNFLSIDKILKSLNN